MNVLTTCPVCSFSELRPFYQVRNVPVHCNLLWDDRAAAQACARGDIQLAICARCGFMTNVRFAEELTSYSQHYDNSLFFSPLYRQYAEQSAADLLRRYDLYQKTIIDIGAGQGDFIRMLCRMGQNCGVGFDPALDEARLAEGLKDHVLFIRDIYSARYSHYKADLFCCRHVLEHLPYPGQLLSAVRHAVDGDLAAALFFQVPNSHYALSKGAIWDIIYEHCSYYTVSSLQYTFSDNGFLVQEIVKEFGGQYLSLHALSANGPAERPSRPQARPDLIVDYQKKADELIEEWNARLHEMKNRSLSVVLWGAGSKGVSFLNMVEMADSISAIVDLNPRKQGHFSPGTGHAIISLDELARIDPKVVIVANPVYAKEVRHLLQQLSLRVEVISL